MKNEEGKMKNKEEKMKKMNGERINNMGRILA